MVFFCYGMVQKRQNSLIRLLCTVNLYAIFSIMSYMTGDGIFVITLLITGEGDMLLHVNYLSLSL